MTDVYDKETRSHVMSSIRAKDTKPEKFVRSLLHQHGYRFRLHRRDLPGSPDVVLPKYNSVIFVHGCFWHQHPGCNLSKRPKSNIDYWHKKLARNVERDKENIAKLEENGWEVLVIWECETSKSKIILEKIKDFLK